MSTGFPPVTIPRTEARTIWSSIVDQEYELFIAFPPSYTESSSSYPVLYLLDGNALFGMVTQMVRSLQRGKQLPDLIIVGIGYTTDMRGERMVLRARDYTPTELDENPDEHYELGETGGAGNFLRFLAEELIPFIEANYRVDPADRVLAGTSLGGLFVLYTLLHRPDLFTRYVASSPALWWDNRVMFAYERELAAKRKRLPVRAFISVGSLEEEVMAQMVSTVYQFAARLKSREYQDFDLTTVVFNDEMHQSVIPGALSRGLRVVFRG
jgi:predicted alpha/beta superfamily hydrolase